MEKNSRKKTSTKLGKTRTNVIKGQEYRKFETSQEKFFSYQARSEFSGKLWTIVPNHNERCQKLDKLYCDNNRTCHHWKHSHISKLKPHEKHSNTPPPKKTKKKLDTLIQVKTCPLNSNYLFDNPSRNYQETNQIILNIKCKSKNNINSSKNNSK